MAVDRRRPRPLRQHRADRDRGAVDPVGRRRGPRAGEATAADQLPRSHAEPRAAGDVPHVVAGRDAPVRAAGVRQDLPGPRHRRRAGRPVRQHRAARRVGHVPRPERAEAARGLRERPAERTLRAVPRRDRRAGHEAVEPDPVRGSQRRGAAPHGDGRHGLGQRRGLRGRSDEPAVGRRSGPAPAGSVRSGAAGPAAGSSGPGRDPHVPPEGPSARRSDRCRAPGGEDGAVLGSGPPTRVRVGRRDRARGLDGLGAASDRSPRPISIGRSRTSTRAPVPGSRWRGTSPSSPTRAVATTTCSTTCGSTRCSDPDRRRDRGFERGAIRVAERGSRMARCPP